MAQLWYEAAFAENIALLAESALRVLEMMQLGEVEDQEDKEDTAYFVTYDQELQTLQEIIQDKVVHLLNDLENSVKRALLDNNGITRLCVFFGRQKANDVLLSHMITFLNDKADWHLRQAFFDNIVGIAAYVGWQSSEIVKPLIEQGLCDTEEFIVHKSLGALKSLTELGLLQKQMLHHFVKIVVPLLAHPGMWIRHGSVGFVSAVAQKLNIADIHCNLLPALKPFLKSDIIQIEKEVLLLNTLQDPIPRAVFDYIVRSNLVERIFSILQKQSYIRSISRQGHKPDYPELDDAMTQVFKRLTFLGCSEPHEDKILALKDFILKLNRARAGSDTASLASSDVKRGHIHLTSLVTRVPTRRHADLNKSSQSKTDPTSSIKKKGATLDSQASTMNPEWKSMFGSTSSDRSLSSSPSQKRF